MGATLWEETVSTQRVGDWLCDKIGRLTRQVYDSSDNPLDFTADYVFDLVGNRLQKNTDQP